MLFRSFKDKEFPVQGLAICSIAKNRHGSTKNIPMEFTGSTMKFKTHYLTLDEDKIRTTNSSDVPF